jgi:hypothetical protein
MSDILPQILRRLKKVKETGAGWQACCPVHGDHSPSLTIAEGDDGRILMRCHAEQGCTFDAICQALGLEPKDLMPPSGGRPRSLPRAASKPAAPDRREGKPVQQFKRPAEAVAALVKQRGKPAGQWAYHDADGREVCIVNRWNRQGGGKDFLPVSLTAEGTWVMKAMPEPRPLYHLPDLSGAELVVVTEGEKAADAARSLGFVATTCCGGCKAFEKTDWSPLSGKSVLILPDNDRPGEAYAGGVASALLRLDPPATVRIVDLPGLPEGGDVVEWIEGHGDSAEPATMKAELERIASQAGFARLDKRPNEDVSGEETKKNPAGPEPVLVRMADVAPEQVRWLWPGRIPLGKLTLLAGPGGLGKSMLTADIAARVSRGKAWTDGPVPPRGDVLLISAEDDPGDTIRPRLDAAGADVCRVFHLPGIRSTREDGEVIEMSWSLSDCDMLATALNQMADCKLVVIDPIGSYLGGRVDAHRDNEVRSALDPLKRLAAERGIAVVLVAHIRKGASAHADDMVLGSRAFTTLCRGVLHLVPDEQSKDRRLLLPGKINIAKKADGLAFTIVDGPRLEWEAEPVTQTADDHYTAASRPGPDADALKEAEDFLRTALAHGPRLTKEIEEEGREGYGLSRRTLERARASLGVCTFKEGKKWYLELKSTPPRIFHAPKLGELGGLGGDENSPEKQAFRDDENSSPPSPPSSLCLEEDGGLGGYDPETIFGLK